MFLSELILFPSFHCFFSDLYILLPAVHENTTNLFDFKESQNGDWVVKRLFGGGWGVKVVMGRIETRKYRRK